MSYPLMSTRMKRTTISMKRRFEVFFTTTALYNVSYVGVPARSSNFENRRGPRAEKFARPTLTSNIQLRFIGKWVLNKLDGKFVVAALDRIISVACHRLHPISRIETRNMSIAFSQTKKNRPNTRLYSTQHAYLNQLSRRI